MLIFALSPHARSAKPPLRGEEFVDFDQSSVKGTMLPVLQNRIVQDAYFENTVLLYASQWIVKTFVNTPASIRGE